MSPDICACDAPDPEPLRRRFVCAACKLQIPTKDALVGVLFRIRMDQRRTSERLAILEAETPVEPGLYTLAQAATRLNRSEDFLRDHQTEFRCVRLVPGPRAALMFPVHVIEAKIAGEAVDPPRADPPRATPRRSPVKTSTRLLEIKGKAA